MTQLKLDTKKNREIQELLKKKGHNVDLYTIEHTIKNKEEMLENLREIKDYMNTDMMLGFESTLSNNHRKLRVKGYTKNDKEIGENILNLIIKEMLKVSNINYMNPTIKGKIPFRYRESWIKYDGQVDLKEFFGRLRFKESLRLGFEFPKSIEPTEDDKSIQQYLYELGHPIDLMNTSELKNKKKLLKTLSKIYPDPKSTAKILISVQITDKHKNSEIDLLTYTPDLHSTGRFILHTLGEFFIDVSVLNNKYSDVRGHGVQFRYTGKWKVWRESGFENPFESFYQKTFQVQNVKTLDGGKIFSKTFLLQDNDEDKLAEHKNEEDKEKLYPFSHLGYTIIGEKWKDYASDNYIYHFVIRDDKTGYLEWRKEVNVRAENLNQAKKKLKEYMKAGHHEKNMTRKDHIN
jgi:hypothetical protein